MERDLCTSNSWFGWFKYKLGNTECKFSAVELMALNLEEVIDILNAIVVDLTIKVEFLKKKGGTS